MKKNKPNWIIDRHILESETDQGDFIPALMNSGSDFFVTRYVPFADNEYGPKEWETQPTILYGSWNYINKCDIGFSPGAYGFSKNLDVNVYYNHVPKDLLLNGDGIITTFGQFKNDPKRFFELFHELSRIFIRPVSGFKTFTGFVLDINEIDYELNSTMQLTSVMDETYILVAPYKQILDEQRFLIVDGRVVDGSLYKKNGKSHIDGSCLNDSFIGSFNVAKQMAKNAWQPDSIYICDVARTHDGFQIIELNSFACAGLYGMNKPIVIEAINKFAMKEWE